MASKEAYQKKLEAQLAEWDAERRQLEARIAKKNADVQIKYQDTIEELERHQQQLQQRLEELRSRGDEAWQDLSKGIDASLEQMRSAWQSAVDRFRK